MDSYRNTNEFTNRASTRTKTLLYWLADILEGKKGFAYHDTKYLGNLRRTTWAETGEYLKHVLAPLRIVPVLIGNKVLFLDVLGCTQDQMVAREFVCDTSWKI